MRVIASATAKNATADAHAGVATTSSAPKPVATPRPPRPRSVTGQQCPDTANTAATASATDRPELGSGKTTSAKTTSAKTTASEPFTISSTATSRPAPVPSVRNVLVAPVD